MQSGGWIPIPSVEGILDPEERYFSLLSRCMYPPGLSYSVVYTTASTAYIAAGRSTPTAKSVNPLGSPRVTFPIILNPPTASERDNTSTYYSVTT